jgi:hypothetical protein
MANRIPDWAAVVGLIGSGQEIHDGEESGLQQWIDAVVNTGTGAMWDVHAPPGIVEQLNFRGIQTYSEPLLTLNTTIRSHFGENLHHWVNAVIGDIEMTYEDIQRLYEEIKESGFRIYLTSDLIKAKRYVWDRYEKSPESRYGMICSSRDKSLKDYGMATLPWPKTPDYGRWFNEGVDHPKSGCRLELPFTEFGTQGLELDFTIMGWGSDFILSNSKWDHSRTKRYGHQSKIKDSLSLRRNSYRVLLTRSRDGMILYLPDTELLSETREHLKKCGITELK